MIHSSHAFQHYIKQSERASHAFLGQDAATAVEEVTVPSLASHIVGYATSPLLDLMETVVGPSSKGKQHTRTEHVADKPLPMPTGGQKQSRQAKAKAKAKPRKPKQKTNRRRYKQKQRKAPVSQSTPVARRTTGRRSLTTVPAPAIIGTKRNSGFVMNFRKGLREGCLGIDGSMMLGTVVAATGEVSPGVEKTFAAIAMGGNTTRLTNGVMMAPSNSFYFGTPVYIFSQLFERFLLTTWLEYRPMVGTGTYGNIKLLFCEDPLTMYAVTGKPHNSNNSPNTMLATNEPFDSGDFAGMPRVDEGSVWLNWETTKSHRYQQQDPNYTTMTSYDGAVNPASTTAIDLRQPIAGFWAISGSNLPDQSTNTTAPMGELWVHYELDLCDLVTSAPVLGPIGKPISLRKTVNTMDILAVQVAEILKQQEGKADEKSTVQRSRSRAREQATTEKKTH